MNIRLVERFGLIGTFAGALAFYFLLALVPLFILAATLVYNVLHVDIIPQMEELLRQLLPETLKAAPGKVGAAVHMGTSKGWFTLGFVGTLWASASFMNELARAIHLLFADQMDASAGGWLRWLKSIGLMVVWCGAVVGVCIILLLGHELRQSLAHWPLVASWTAGFSSLLRSLATFLLVFFSVFLTFVLVPRGKPRWAATVWGALAVSVCWMVMGVVLGRVMPVIWAQSPLPVAFGSFLVTMFWAYACCWVLLFGALLVSHYGRKV